MLLFYAPWCKNCKAFHPKYEEVAKKLKEKNPKLRLAKIDATENEVESVDISGFPTVKFYTLEIKKIKIHQIIMVIEVLKILLNSLKTNAVTPIVYEKEKKEEKKDD